MQKLNREDFLLILLIFLSLLTYVVNFYFKNYFNLGARGDFESFVFNNIQLFKQDPLTAIKNYGLLGDANWPLFYLLHAYLNPFSGDVDKYLLSTTFIGFLTFLIFFFSVKNLKFNLLQSLAIASLILILPWFSARAHWGTSGNLGWFFLILSFYVFTKLKYLWLDENKKIFNLFFICFFSSVALYIRPSLVFFPIFFTFWYLFSKENLKNKFLLTLFYFIFSLPGLFLIYFWSGIYDHKNSNVVLVYYNYSYIIKNIPLIMNFFFFYYCPLLLFLIYEKGLKYFLKKYIFSFFIFVFIFLILLIINKLDYLSNYDLGGGAILEFGYLIHDEKNIFFLITSALGGSILFEHIKINFKNNFILIVTIFVIYGFPKYLYQDYLEPLILFIFFCDILESSLIELSKKYFNKLIIFYFFYFSVYNFTSIIYKNLY